MKRIHLAVLATLSISSLAAVACVDSAPTSIPTDAGEIEDSGSSDAGPGTDSSPIRDSGPAADAADANAWSPSQLTGLALWLAGDEGVTGTANVTKWADQSGNGNDFVQATALNQPALSAAAVHGHAALKFVSTADSYLALQPLPASLTFGTGDFAVIEVVEWDNSPTDPAKQNKSYANLWVANGTYGLFANNPGPPNASVYAQFAGTSVATAATTLNDGQYRTVGVRRSGTVLEARQNGVAATATIAGTQDVTSGSIGVFIGGRISTEGANQALDGHIAEVVAVKGTLADADAALLEAYFKSKYGL